MIKVLKKLLCCILPVFVALFICNTSASATAVNDGEEIELNTDLNYYITINYDGKDVMGIESSDIVFADIISGRIKVTDKIPKGLTFKDFVHSSDGTIGAISRKDNIIRCSGKVYDDNPNSSATQGEWDEQNLSYNYHGLHYDKRTNTVSYYVEGLKAGCKLTVGIVTTTPEKVDDSETEEIEIRRDFYNTAHAIEKNIYAKSNTVHSYIGRDIADLYAVSYEYAGDVPANAPDVPSQTQYITNSKVSVEEAPTLSGYTFSGWQSDEVAPENGIFNMPTNEVVFRGHFTKATDPQKYKVEYVIDENVPEGYITPTAKYYEPGDEIQLDETGNYSFYGYSFKGWTNEEIELSETGFTMPEKDIVLHGRFEKNQRTVTYAFTGNIIPPNSEEILPAAARYEVGSDIELASVQNREGYTFKGWYHEKFFAMPDQDLTVYGEWGYEDGLISPEISIETLSGSKIFKNGEEVKFVTTIKNTSEFEIRNVYVQEMLEGSEFIDEQSTETRLTSAKLFESGDNLYKIETPTLARIPKIAAGGSVRIYSKYAPNAKKESDYTNTVILVAAEADDSHPGYNFNTQNDNTASVVFRVVFDTPINPQTIDSISKVVYTIFQSAIAILLAFMINKYLDKAKAAKFLRNNAKYFAIPLVAIVGTFAIASAVPAENNGNQIDIESQNSSYSQGDAAAWKIEKTAKWTSKTTAEISLRVDSIEKQSGNKKDIILVLDNSTSMEGEKLRDIKTNTKELIEDTLENEENRFAVISFASEAQILSTLTNDATQLSSAIDSIAAFGSTNYYKALMKVTELLESEHYQEDRDTIVLFLTDGVPVKQSPLEAAQYMVLKNKYENLTLNAVQYNMGETIIPQLVAMSDEQFSINEGTQIDKILFQAANVPYYYDTFEIEDLIDTRYWNLDNVDTNIGGAEMEGDDTIKWNLGNHFRPGQIMAPELKIRLNLKPEYVEADNSWPTSRKTTAKSAIIDNGNEEVTTNETPYLQHKYNVSYEVNTPPGCSSESITLPNTARYFVYDNVEVEQAEISCENYNFAGWQVATEHITQINTNYFRMPSSDTTLRAVWTKFTLDKYTEGTLHEKVSTTLDMGDAFNRRIKRLSGTGDENKVIKTIKRAAALPANFDKNDNGNKLSAYREDIPVYGWYEAGVIYYYTEADEIYLNADSSRMFLQLKALEDLSFFREWDTSKMTNMSEMFRQCSTLKNLDELANFNVSNVENMYEAFGYMTSLSSINGLENWDTSKVKNISNLFYNDKSISNIDSLAKWNVSKVENMYGIFGGMETLADISGLAKWDVSNVTQLSSAFSGTKSLINYDPIKNWNISSVTTLNSTFSGTVMTNVDFLEKWDTSNVTDMSATFKAAIYLSNIEGLKKWNTSNVTDMSETFNQNYSLESLKSLKDWNVGNVRMMNGMFELDYKLKDLDGIGDWDTSKVENMSWMFAQSGLESLDALLNFDVSNVTSMSYMFSANRSLKNIDGAIKWNTSKVKTMTNMFASCTELRNVDGALNWNTESLVNLKATFNAASKLENVDGLRKWNTQNVKDLSNFLTSTTSLQNIDGLSEWNTESVEDISSMLSSSIKITNVNALKKWKTSNIKNMSAAFNSTAKLQDITGLEDWDVSNVENMNSLFSYSFINSTDSLFKWKTGKVKDMSGLFSNAKIVNVDGLSKWDVSNVTTISNIFAGARQLKNVDGLEKWNTANITNMSYMFSEAEQLENLDGLSGWTTPKVQQMVGIFKGTSALSDFSGVSGWDTSKVINMSKAFYHSHISDLSYISGWDVSSVTNMSEMFYYAGNIASFAPINNWEPDSLEITTDMFKGIPDTVPRPNWF